MLPEWGAMARPCTQQLDIWKNVWLRALIKCTSWTASSPWLLLRCLQQRTWRHQCESQDFPVLRKEPIRQWTLVKLVNRLHCTHTPLISPLKAFLYKPLGSRFAHSSTLVSTNTSMNGSSGLCFRCNSRAKSRSALYGEMNDVIAMAVDEAKRSDTSEMRRMFSSRSLGENPRSLLRPNRMLSPSRRKADFFRCNRCCSRATATVDLPEAERPVNQIVMPFWFKRLLRSS